MSIGKPQVFVAGTNGSVSCSVTTSDWVLLAVAVAAIARGRAMTMGSSARLITVPPFGSRPIGQMAVLRIRLRPQELLRKRSGDRLVQRVCDRFAERECPPLGHRGCECGLAERHT